MTRIALIAAVLALAANVRAEAPKASADGARAFADKVVAAAGGPDKLLKFFRFRERLNVSSDPAKTPSERSSTVAPPDGWWFGTKFRPKIEPKMLAYAWTLGVLTDAKTKLELLPEVTEADRPAVGLRVTGSVEPALDMYFDKAELRLVRIDWKTSIHRFSDWREVDGCRYAAKVAGYRKTTGKPWYFTEIVEIERLRELPADLKK